METDPNKVAVRVVFMDRWPHDGHTGLECSMCHADVYLPDFRDTVEEQLCQGAVVVCTQCRPELRARLDAQPGARARRLGMG